MKGNDSMSEKISRKSPYSTLDISYIAMFSALLAVGAWLSVPATVPFTMQTFSLFLTLLVLGGKRGSTAVLVYLLLGAVGLPVFSGFRGGLGHLLGSTGGYLLGYYASALAFWAFESATKSKKILLYLNLLGTYLLCYLVGTLWFSQVYSATSSEIGLFASFQLCVLPYLLPDFLKFLLACTVSSRIKPYVKH